MYAGQGPALFRLIGRKTLNREHCDGSTGPLRTGLPSTGIGSRDGGRYR